MPDKPISGLPEITAINDTDLLTAVRPGDPVNTKNKKINGLNAKNSFAGVACPDEGHIYHVASLPLGNDSNSGKCRSRALLYSSTAYTKIITNETPSSTNRFTIYNPDAHEENSFQTADWIDIYEPNTNYSAATHNLVGNSNVIINKAEIFGGAICIHRTGAGIANFYAKELKGFGIGTNVLFDVNGGPTTIRVENFNPNSGDISVRVQENNIAYVYTPVARGEFNVQAGATLYLMTLDASTATFTGTGTVYKFSLKGGGIIEPFLSYISHPTFTNDTQLVDKKYVDDSVIGGINQNHIYYVGSHGDDITNDGKNIEDAFATFNKAISEVNSQSPDINNQFAIRCHEKNKFDAWYNLTDSYVDIWAPHVTFWVSEVYGVFNITGGENNLTLGTVIADSSDGAVNINVSTTSNIYLNIDKLENTGTGAGLRIFQGIVNGYIKNIDKLDVRADAEINLYLSRVTGNIDLANGSSGSLLIGEHTGGTLTKGTTSTISVQILNPFIIKSNGGTIDPILDYSSHPTFTSDTQLVDKKYVDDSSGSATFLDLTDTPSSYNNAKGVYVTNDSINGIVESNIKIDDSSAGEIRISYSGTDLSVVGDSQLDQDLRTTSSPTFYDINITTGIFAPLDTNRVSTTQASGTYTPSFTATAGSNRCIILGIASDNHAGAAWSAISWAGKNMRHVYGTGGNWDNNALDFFYLMEEDLVAITGSHTLLISWTNQPPAANLGYVWGVYENVNQISPFKSRQIKVNITDNPISLNILDCSIDDLVIGLGYTDFDIGTWTVSSPFTKRTEAIFNSARLALSDAVATTTTTNCTYTSSEGPAAGIIGFGLRGINK